jgi:phospholipid/cholesterol/gamma-HCH transport system substrate-binding protein
MQKIAPSPGRLAVMTLFALSCFGLLLFLWLSFGGTTPLKPKGYRFQVAFPEATQLAFEADVRIAGVTVGRVRTVERDPRGNRALATIELDDERLAPIPSNARAILRQKTLLGETFVELTPGTRGARPLPEGARLADARVQDTVELDEILGALDPGTRRAFRAWQQDMGKAIGKRGLDLNDAIGILPGFLEEGTELLTELDTEREAVRRLVRNTGVVFGALTEREDELRRLITTSGEVFETTARRNDRLAEAIGIFPTFLDESRATFSRTRRFAHDSRPVVRMLREPVRDLGPTLGDVRRLAPGLRSTFTGLDRLASASERGMPALTEIVRGLRPVLGELEPFLAEINPLLRWLEVNQYMTGDFYTLGATALADRMPTLQPGARGHYLRQFGPNGVESAAMHREQLSTHRGNAYFKGLELTGRKIGQHAIYPSWTCRNAGGEVETDEEQFGGRQGRSAACYEPEHLEFQGRLTRYPQLQAGSAGP